MYQIKTNKQVLGLIMGRKRRGIVNIPYASLNSMASTTLQSIGQSLVGSEIASFKLLEITTGSQKVAIKVTGVDAPHWEKYLTLKFQLKD